MINKTAMEIQKENVKQALELIKENPELPIMPLVNYEVAAGDECMYWVGSWGKAEIDDYCTHDERVHFLSDGIDELFEQFFGNTIEDASPEYRKKLVESMGWTKAIFIKIELEN